ncbi:hypothetical protein HDU82_003749 [Entophlyctis luteolus]|nr:hypothetical protein HDU82_003749 [Entophlyctis luteolus]
MSGLDPAKIHWMMTNLPLLPLRRPGSEFPRTHSAPSRMMLLLALLPTFAVADCPACQNRSITNPCIDQPNMASFWANGQVSNDLGATYGDLYSISNKYITNFGSTAGSVSFTFGSASEFLYADFNVYGKCSAAWGVNYDGVQLVLAAQSAGVTFDIHIQMFADSTCTVVDGNTDVVFHSADIAQFSNSYEYESFVIPFSQQGINRTNIKNWLITNVQPAGSTLELGCASLYQSSIPQIGTVSASVAAPASASSSSSSSSSTSATDSSSSGSAVLPVIITVVVVAVIVFGCCFCRCGGSRGNAPRRAQPVPTMAARMARSADEDDDMREHLVRPASAASARSIPPRTGSSRSHVSTPPPPPPPRPDPPAPAARNNANPRKWHPLPELNFRAEKTKAADRASLNSYSGSSFLGSSWRGMKDEMYDIFNRYKNEGMPA